MLIWLRVGVALLVVLAALGVLEVFGVSNLLGERVDDDVAHGRTNEFFWLMIFFVVMATSLLAAARRGAERLQRALRPSRR